MKRKNFRRFRKKGKVRRKEKFTEGNGLREIGLRILAKGEETQDTRLRGGEESATRGEVPQIGNSWP